MTVSRCNDCTLKLIGSLILFPRNLFHFSERKPEVSAERRKQRELSWIGRLDRRLTLQVIDSPAVRSSESAFDRAFVHFWPIHIYMYIYIYIYLFIYFFFSDGLRVRASTLFTVRAAPSSFARRTLRPSTSFGADFLLGYQSATLVGLSAQPHHKVARYQVPVSAPRRVTCGARFDPGWQTNKVPRRCTRVHRGAARAQLRVSKA